MDKIIETCKLILFSGSIKDDAKSLDVCFTKTIYRKKQNAFAAIAEGKKRPYVLWIEENKLWCSCDDYKYNKRPLNNNETGNLYSCKHLRSLAIRAVIKGVSCA